MDAAIQKTRDPAIDMLKALSIMAVVFYHAKYAFEIDLSRTFTLRIAMFNTVHQLLYLHVPVFFFVHGYLSLGKPFDCRKHIIKMARYLFLTVFWATVCCVAAHLMNNTPITAKQLLTDWVEMPTRGACYHLWFMLAMIGIGIIEPLLKSAWQNNRNAFFFFAGFVTIICMVNPAVNEIGNVLCWIIKGNNPAFAYNFFPKFGYFLSCYGFSFVLYCVGGIVKEYYSVLHRVVKPWMCMAVLTLCLITVCLYALFMIKTAHCNWSATYAYAMPMTVPATICVFLIAKQYRGEWRGHRFFELVSQDTMGIYLSHYLLRNITKNYIGVLGGEHYLITNLLYFILLFLVSWGLTRTLKRISLLRNIVS